MDLVGELFWIPLIPLKKHDIWKCTICRECLVSLTCIAPPIQSCMHGEFMLGVEADDRMGDA